MPLPYVCKYVCVCMYVSVYLYFCLSTSVCLYICLSVCLSIYISVCLSVHLTYLVSSNSSSLTLFPHSFCPICFGALPSVVVLTARLLCGRPDVDPLKRINLLVVLFFLSYNMSVTENTINMSVVIFPVK